MTRLPSSPMPWLIGVVATVLAAIVMVYYVDLLQEAVAKGSQTRYAQQNASPAPVKAAVRNLVSSAN